MFNQFTCNQDDHSKNWAFLKTMLASGRWRLSMT
ncbi:HipA domain-containing protein [Alloalcanivorax balearicus]|nr:HipA domain-containing protein [Alloalcanivorax balearicus]